MKFSFNHTNINVLDLDKSLAFYKEALGLVELEKVEAPDGSFKIAFLGDGGAFYKLELTWLRDHKEPYELGDNESHIAFAVEDFDAAYKFHKEKGWVCFENPHMGIYFIEDPDGYWLEVVPKR